MQTHLTSYTAHDEENLQQTTRVNTTKTSRAQVHSCSQTDTEKKLHDIKHFLLCSFKSKVKLNLSGLKQSSKNVQACFQKPSQQRHLMVKAATFKPLWQASRLTWGRCKATWDVRRPNGAVDDPFMTSEGGQRWTESRVPLTEIKLTWRRQNADGEGKKGETFILPLSPFDPTIQKLSGFLLESDSSPQCTPAHTSQSEHLCVCLCVCKHVCVTSCVCSLATLSGALWLAVSHSWRVPSPPPATKMCSLASLHATSNRPSLHSQLRHTHTRMT